MTDASSARMSDDRAGTLAASDRSSLGPTVLPTELQTLHLLAIPFDPEVTAVGRGVAAVGEPLLEGLRGGIARLDRQSDFVDSLILADRLELNASPDLGAGGAAAVARRALAEPTRS